jgi:hypothetical protein
MYPISGEIRSLHGLLKPRLWGTVAACGLVLPHEQIGGTLEPASVLILPKQPAVDTPEINFRSSGLVVNLAGSMT